MTPKLTRIKAALRQHIEEAEEATAGPWYYWNRPDNDLIATGKDEGRLICALAGMTSKPNEFAFIARARTMSPLACKGLLLAIEWIEQSFALLSTINLSPCNGGSCIVATDADATLEALTQQTQAKLQEIESLFPDEI